MKSLDPWKLPLGGTVLIEASAGTGKTHTLTTLYLRLLVEHDLLPSEILVVTYTQAATAELRERVRGRIRRAIAAGEAEDSEASEVDTEDRELGRAAREKRLTGGGPDPLRRALQEFDEAAIFTIHGFCQRTLGQNAFESGLAFDAELIEASGLLEQTLARDLWARGIGEQEPAFVEWLLQGNGSRWEFEPGALKRNLLGLLGADEEMPVLPVDASSSSKSSRFAELQADLAAAWKYWAEAWPASRDVVRAWLLECPDLNRSKYNAKTIEATWLPEIEAFCDALTSRSEQGLPVAIGLPDWWQKLTPEGLAKGVKKAGKPLEDPIFDAFEQILSAAAKLEASYSAHALAMRGSFVERAREESRRRRDERHQLVFDDLLSELRAALRPPEGNRLVEQLRSQYRFALIDEFQDTDPVQYEIFRRVWHLDDRDESRASTGGLVLIGDPKQAIYSFRGADLFTYLEAKKDACDAVYGLDVNWRSNPGLIRAINELFDRPESAFGFEAIEFNPVSPRSDIPEELYAPTRSSAGLRVLLAEYGRAAEGGPLEASSSEAAGDKKAAKTKKEKRHELPLRFGRAELMDALARDVADLLDSDATIGGRILRPSDVAVLCRRKAELDRARRALEALGIPCVDRGDADVFESREGWELLCVLRAMLRSGDQRLLRAALATGALGWDALALSQLSDDSIELAEISERYAEYARIWRQSGFMRAFESWRRQEGVTSRLLTYVDGERRLTNWLHLAELLQRVASDRAPSRSGLANWLERAIADPDVRTVFGSDASLLRLESDDEAVSLITLHRSKGLEFEIVYLPCLWEDESPRGPKEGDFEKSTGRLPPVRCHDPEVGKRILDLGGPGYDEHLSRQKAESLSESVRLLYVGLTRAKQQCVVMWGAIGLGKYASTSLAWLLAAPTWESSPDNDRSKSIDAIRSWGDDGWGAAFRALAEAAGAGAVSIESADWSPRPRWMGSTEPHPELHFERTTRPMPLARVTTSFSGLMRGAFRPVEASIGPAVIGRDLDSEVGYVATPDPIGASDLMADMDSFPRGADAGTLLHEVLERVQFSSWEEPQVRQLAAQTLARHGFESSLEDQVLHVVRSVAESPLRVSPRPFRLADVAPGQLRAEMEFTLAAPGGPDPVGFTSVALGRLLGEASSNSPLRRYADRVARLNWRQLRGYLRGFIDAVFFDGERYFLVDYKSNHLGSRQIDYTPDNLVVPMLEHDYVLQYLIYSVALDRHLSQTLEGYSYAKHFGGAYYLFLRGIAAGHSPGCGVFYDRPEEDLVKAVSGLLGMGRYEGERV
jgi:exodeoxyribonuclease V beta subunit